jgi:predicted metal-dependent peptidase
VAIDTSGSMPDEFLQKILSELQYLFELLKPTEVTEEERNQRLKELQKNKK